MKKLVITAAIYENDKLNSGGCLKSDDAVKQAVVKAYEAGASVVYLHLDYDGKNNSEQGMKHLGTVLDEIYDICPEVLVIPELFKETYGLGEEEFKIAEEEPEISVLNCDMGVSSSDTEGTEAKIRSLGNTMLDNGVRPILKCCDKGMVDTAMRLYREGWMTDPLLFLFVLGVRGGMDQTIDNLFYLKNSVPPTAIWSVECRGDNYIDMAAAAMLMGGNVSVGDESCDTTELIDKIRRVIDIAERLGIKPASPAETRAIMSLNIKYRRIIDDHLL